MITLLRSLIKDENGQGLVEYGMILMLVSVTAGVVLSTVLAPNINGALGAAAAQI